MPELPFSKYFVPASLRDLPTVATPSVRYVELHCKTNFSFLEGASHPSELVALAHGRAWAMPGWPSPIGTVSPGVRPSSRRGEGGRPQTRWWSSGPKYSLVDSGPVLLWAMNREWLRPALSALDPRPSSWAPKGECRYLAFADVAEHASGLLVGVLLPSGRGTRQREFRTDGKKSFS